MKKLFSLMLMLQVFSVSFVSVFAQSATDAELAALLADLEGVPAIEEPQAEPSGEEDLENEFVFPDLEEEVPPQEQHQAAEEILNQLDSDQWAYAGEEKIEVRNITTTSATLVATQITYNNVPVTEYKVYYSDKTLATVQDFNAISDRVLAVSGTDGTNVLLEFDNLAPNTTYYVVVVPVHPTDPTQEPLSFISDEIMFITQQEMVAPAAVEKALENVSYTYKDSMVEVTWTPSAAAQSVNIELRHQSEAAYKPLGSAQFQDAKFGFMVTQQGTFFLKMNALDAAGNPVGQEHIQTIKIDEVQQPAEVVQAAPEVGPTTNLLIALLLASMIGYSVVRWRKATY